MLSSTELAAHLAALRLSPPEAAQLLGVSPRTLRRWLEGEEVPGPAEAALKAWRVLDDRLLPWKPDSVSLSEDDTDQIERHRRHATEMAAMVKRVEARGGPTNPWTVDLAKNEATFGPFEVNFHRLHNGGFSLSSYRRKDIPPDVARDAPYVEDAAFCIAKSFGSARASSEALQAVAKYTRENSSVFVRNGPRLLDPAETKRRRQAIESLADKISQLADRAAEGSAKYEQFEAILNDLHKLGFFPEMSLISAVARALVW
jgi:Homeodomain-like domain-containing protein